MANRAEDAARQPAVRELARMLHEQKKQISNLSKPQLAFSSIEDGAIPEYDTDGNLKSIVGKQFDGGHGVLVTSDPEPGRPTSPIVEQGPLSLTARWDGLWLDAQGNPDETIPTPTYHSRVEVHASLDPGFAPVSMDTFRGSIESPRGGEIVISPLSGGPWYIKLVARSLSGNAGPESPATAGTPEPLMTEGDIDSAVGTHLSASGLVQIVHWDEEPLEPANGWTEGAVWFQTSGPGSEGTTVSWHRWDGAAWVEQPKFDEAFMPLINIGTGTFGTLEGQRISLNSVGREQLVTGTDEIIKNPRWMDAEYENHYGPQFVYEDTEHTILNTDGWSWDTNPANLRFGQPHQLIVQGTATNTGKWMHMPLGPRFPAYGGEKFAIGFDTFGGDATMYLSMLLVPFDINGVRITGVPININSSITDPDRTWTSRSVVITLPPGTHSVQPWIEKQGTPGTGASGYVMVGRTSVTRAMQSGAPEGSSLELSANGLRLFDTEGAEVVNLTSAPPNYFSIRDTNGNTIANIGRLETGDGTGLYEGVVSADNLSSEKDPEFVGDRLLGTLKDWESPASWERSGWLDDLSRGCIAYGRRMVNGRQITNGEFAQMELQFDYFAGRSYLIVISPLSCYLDAGSYGYMRVRREYSDQTSARPTISSPFLRQWTVRNLATGNSMYMLGGSFLLDAGATATCKMLITVGAEPGRIQIWDSSIHSSLQVSVYDMGMRTDDTAINREDSKYYPTGVTTEPTPDPVVKNYTKTYSANGYRSFYTSGGHYNWNTSKMYQGNSPGVGGLQSIATFPSMTGDLSGATITGMRAYFYFEHWYYNSGGTAKIGVHGSSSLPGTKPSITTVATSSSWPKPGGRWVNIPSAYWNGFKTGAYRGVALGDTSPSTTEYGYARGSATKIEIKYKK